MTQQLKRFIAAQWLEEQAQALPEEKNAEKWQLEFAVALLREEHVDPLADLKEKYAKQGLLLRFDEEGVAHIGPKDPSHE